ncbi:hypothetical protein KC660_02245 [Candidatus Dojkabacteria bacterium]|uniref:Uncharacterized protein n=1 Tax=Candidatus Dojkabacteria bacterium TaxID=2099670 RepID=A0A955L3H9_9BACT|nr:hypothetical protein [Candidatus Dojkabacteria bacterium]
MKTKKKFRTPNYIRLGFIKNRFINRKRLMEDIGKIDISNPTELENRLKQRNLRKFFSKVQKQKSKPYLN